MEQLSDAEMLACTIAHMLDDDAGECLIGGSGQVVSIFDLSLMLCDVLRAARLKTLVSAATSNAVICMTADLAIYRATTRAVS